MSLSHNKLLNSLSRIQVNRTIEKLCTQDEKNQVRSIIQNAIEAFSDAISYIDEKKQEIDQIKSQIDELTLQQKEGSKIISEGMQAGKEYITNDSGNLKNTNKMLDKLFDASKALKENVGIPRDINALKEQGREKLAELTKAGFYIDHDGEYNATFSK